MRCNNIVITYSTIMETARVYTPTKLITPRTLISRTTLVTERLRSDRSEAGAEDQSRVEIKPNSARHRRFMPMHHIVYSSKSVINIIFYYYYGACIVWLIIKSDLYNVYIFFLNILFIIITI